MLSNWSSYDAPFAEKLRLAVSNTLIKVRGHQGCCGHHGQPGCWMPADPPREGGTDSGDHPHGHGHEHPHWRVPTGSIRHVTDVFDFDKLSAVVAAASVGALASEVFQPAVDLNGDDTVPLLAKEAGNTVLGTVPRWAPAGFSASGHYWLRIAL
jgi:hypothetical protein